MSYYNKSNVAYDFSRFSPVEEPETEKHENKQQQLAKKKHKAKAKALKPATAVKWVFVSLFVMLSLACIMVGNIKITQLSDQVTTTQKKLDTAKSVQVSLNSKLESRMSLSKVEDYAVNKLGLVKVQSYQIQYVRLTDKDKVELNNDTSGFISFFRNIFDTVVEYFS
jgi:hypothetical protein